MPGFDFGFVRNHPSSLIGEWLFLFGDHIAVARFCLGGIEFDVALPFVRHIVLVEDCLDGTLGNACFAVDALFRVDVKHLVTLVEALHWANNDAIGVFASRAGLGNNMSHGLDLSLQ